MKTKVVVLSFLVVGVFLSMLFYEKSSKTAKNWGERTTLKVGLTPLSLPLDPSNIHSVSQYIAYSQLGRGLVRSNRVGLLEGDLAESWQVSEDFRRHTFTLRAGQKFSDGSPITLEHVKCSFDRQRKFNTAIHFDFNTIKSVSVNKQKLEVGLVDPNPRFASQLEHPEFSILTMENCSQGVGKLDLTVTSGAYSQVSAADGRIVMTRNNHFPEFTAPPILDFVGAERKQLNELLNMGELDFSIGVGDYSEDVLASLKKRHNLRTVLPHIGFSYWLSVNEVHPDLKEISNRLHLSDLIHRGLQSMPIREPFWSFADQLYLPDGGGRVPSDEVQMFWQRLESKNLSWEGRGPIRLLLRNKIWFEAGIKEALEGAGVEYEIDYYHSLTEYAEKTKQFPEQYHLIQINNDYSAVDLFENLKVTLSKNRPLVFQESFSREIESLMKKAGSEPDVSNNLKVYEDIERLLLFEGLVIPIVYNHTVFFVRNDISVQRWSNLYPEVSFWKVLPK